MAELEDEGVTERVTAGEGREGRGTSFEATDQYFSKSSIVQPQEEDLKGRREDALRITPSQRLSCCSFRRFVTRLTLPHRT